MGSSEGEIEVPDPVPLRSGRISTTRHLTLYTIQILFILYVLLPGVKEKKEKRKENKIVCLRTGMAYSSWPVSRRTGEPAEPDESDTRILRTKKKKKKESEDAEGRTNGDSSAARREIDHHRRVLPKCVSKEIFKISDAFVGRLTPSISGVEIDLPRLRVLPLDR